MAFLAALYAVAVFLSSCLLFLAEPMVAKRLLPRLGGSAAVWTTCLVFFQTTLLLGYLYAHWLVTRLRPRTQAHVHSVVLAASLMLLVVTIGPGPHAFSSHPILSVFWLLTALIGLPFFALSATSPLLQAWYANSIATTTTEASVTHQDAATNQAMPAFRLFALSNLASLLALVAYPALIEPHFALHAQTVAWSIGFVIFVVAAVAVVWQSSRLNTPATEPADFSRPGSRPPVSTRAVWILLAACGSLLLCAVTSYLGQNVAAIPLLWVLPLATYLLSFVLAFNGTRFYPRWLMLRLVAVALGSVGYLLYDTHVSLRLQLTVPFFVVTLFVACLFCHGELHRLRPSSQYATSFYLSIAAGGALGAFFVGIIAPVFFSANYELACSLILTAAAALIVTWEQGTAWRLFWLAGVVATFALLFIEAQSYSEDTTVQLRSFYGTLRVRKALHPPGATLIRTLLHGTITHGTQIFGNDLRTTPTTYYAYDSGVGIALRLCCGEQPRRVGVIGLGAGTLAAYGRRGDVFRFYEIDPLVEQLAREVFTYIRESPAAIQVVIGDGRLSLAAEPPQEFDVLVIDAFSGDAVPVHLLTTQAMALYQRHLRPGGILAFHISSQYLNLAPVVWQQANYAGLPVVLIDSHDNEARGEFSADWVLVTANKDFLSRPEVRHDAKEIEIINGLRLWTDDYNSLLPLLK
jgi:spermidine synthase